MRNLRKYGKFIQITMKKKEGSNVKKVFVSVPMRGRTDEEIIGSIVKTENAYADDHPDEDLAFITNAQFSHDDEIDSDVKHPGAWYLSKAIRKMSTCDDAAFDDEWFDYPGCIIEHMVYDLYMKGGDK